MDNLSREEARKLIVKYYSEPVNKGFVGEGEVYEEKSTVCSDRVVFEINVIDNVVADIHFEGEGCAISQAVAEILCSEIRNKDVDSVKKLVNNFELMIKSEKFDIKKVGNLSILINISNVKSRVACVFLPVNSLKKFLYK